MIVVEHTLSRWHSRILHTTVHHVVGGLHRTIAHDGGRTLQRLLLLLLLRGLALVDTFFILAFQLTTLSISLTQYLHNILVLLHSKTLTSSRATNDHSHYIQTMRIALPVLILRLGEQRVEHTSSSNHTSGLDFIIVDIGERRGIASQLQLQQTTSPVAIRQMSLTETCILIDTRLLQGMIHTFGDALLFLKGKGRLHCLGDVLVTLADDILHPRLSTQDGLNHHRI